ncbi:peptidase M20 [Candidatus Koribacter versatilis Ellin345]|uniref:Peptidase M20 n=2 Tax=Candidatus Korobacter versatilis TaxID=658062 RepID=Q1IV58_KORVE|nr:peptidase M20 [Candidatus Koribacter versatilis Ellin345]
MPQRPSSDPRTSHRDLFAHLKDQQSAMQSMLRRIVEHESPSDDKPSCDAMAEMLAQDFGAIGGRTKLHRDKITGNHLQVDFGGPRGAKPVLIVGHYDTVYPLGTLKQMPYRESKGRISGPGVLDMKGGIVQIHGAIAALQTQGGLPRPVTIILVSDEETGSESSRSITEKLAKQSAAAFVCEPAAGTDGALKTARKGVGDYLLRITGVASHSGLDFEKGQSAVLELARQIEKIAGFTDLKRGTTVNPGVIRGGTRSNVIAASAEAEIDVRVSTKRDVERVSKLFARLKPINRRCSLALSGGVNRPPMERTPGTAALFAQAQLIAAELSFSLAERMVGGGSDGNFTGAIVPTLDGLGAVGDGAHAVHEYIFATEMPKRAALLAGLIRAL